LGSNQHENLMLTRTKYLAVPVFIALFAWTNFAAAQSAPKKKFFAITPERNTVINGVALGLASNLIDGEDRTTLTWVNGLNFEIIGLGILLPLIPEDPFLDSDSSDPRWPLVLDSVLTELKKPNWIEIKGLNISPGGLAGAGISFTGVNLSGLNTMTARSKGLATAILINKHGIMHGVQIALFNESVELKGMQIGIFNSSSKTKGIQIGLWNSNEKRSLPLFNWNF